MSHSSAKLGRSTRRQYDHGHTHLEQAVAAGGIRVDVVFVSGQRGASRCAARVREDGIARVPWGVERSAGGEETFGIEIPDQIAQQILTPQHSSTTSQPTFRANQPTHACRSSCSIGCGEDSGPN